MKNLEVHSKWIALISYSGKELTAVCDKLGYGPSVVLSNNPVHEKYPPNMPYGVFEYALKKKDFFQLIDDYATNKTDFIITCHGFNWIIPASICERYDMYNVHPGDIIRYPELIGKDPQRKAIELNLPSTGVIIHKITPQLDQGPIVKYKTFDITEETRTEFTLTQALRDLSIDMWVEVISEKIQ